MSVSVRPIILGWPKTHQYIRAGGFGGGEEGESRRPDGREDYEGASTVGPMTTEPRDALDPALVAAALALVFGSSVVISNPATVVGAAVSAVAAVDPIAYLVVLGVGGILFTAYAVLYVPSQHRQ